MSAIHLKVSKKHHRRLNNPFPRDPRCLPLLRGSLSYDPASFRRHRAFPIGDHFLLSWSSTGGGLFSVSHRSQPERSIWSTVPGAAFLSAASAQTEAAESRGSFVIEDGEIFCICDHQSIEDIRVLQRSDLDEKSENFELISHVLRLEPGADPSARLEDTRFPVCLITGWVFGKKKADKSRRRGARSKAGKNTEIGVSSGRPSVEAKYWFLLDQRTDHQVGFQAKFGEPVVDWGGSGTRASPAIAARRDPHRKFVRLRRIRRFSCLPWPKGFTLLSSHMEEEDDDFAAAPKVLNRVVITYSSEADERFYGFGEQFSRTEFKGWRVPILVQEQGIGRGDQPITFAANLLSYRAGGSWSTTYAPSPFYMTSKMKSLYLEGHGYSVFDLTEPDKVQLQVYGGSARGRMLRGGSPVELLEQYTETIGRHPKLPDWIVSGAVVGMQGGTDAVRRVWTQLQDHSVPVSAFWLQDWVGQRKTVLGSQLWWNWELDHDRYPGWSELVEDLRVAGIRVLAYCNPCLASVDEKPNRRRSMLKEADHLGVLVRDSSGAAYMVPNTAFAVGMMDFTHPAAGDWFKKILRDMVDCGVRGWMADFGEGLPLDARLFSGEDPVSAHNRYPEVWAKVNREFVDEWRRSRSARRGKEEEEEESLVFFTRAGFRGSPRWSMLFWEGDQMVSWQRNDGIKSCVVGLLSGGISGFALNHGDIGGYCTVNLPIIKYRRSEELLLRWTELSAFTVVFRTHEGNNPSANCQFYANHKTLAHFARFAKIYKAWKFYRVQLVQEAAERGLPVSRHLFLHYPEDERVHRLTYHQFLVGAEILVVPVLDKGRREVKAYFPRGEGVPWRHIWSGRLFGGGGGGYEAWIEAPLGNPAVFVKQGSSVGERFLSNLSELNIT